MAIPGVIFRQFGLGAKKMSLYEQLVAAVPQLTPEDFLPDFGTISLQDDCDGQGAFIAKWNHKLPIPDGFKLGK